MGRFIFLNSFKICSRRTTVYIQAPPPWNVLPCSTPCHRLGRLTFVISNKPSVARLLLTELLKLDALLNAHLFKLSSVDRRTQTNVATKFALRTSPNAARSLSTEFMKLDALRNALLHPQPKKNFDAASNPRPLLQLLHPFPPLVLSAEALSSVLSARSAALMRSTTVPTLTRSANNALSN
jgi:hypothetical protein